MRILKNAKVVLIIIVGLLLVIGGVCSLYKYLKQKNRPNIILITIDALRPDHLGCYGYERNTSPNIDELAKNGIMFTQAVSQGPATIPSVPAIMASNYFRSGDWIKEMAKIKNIKFSVPTLQEILSSNGYFTIYISAHSLLPEIEALQQGWNKIIKFSKRKPDAKTVTSQVLRWFKTNRHNPFFLWIHFMDTHAPYKPPVNYKKLFIGDGLYYPAKKIPIIDNPEREGGIYRNLVEDEITDLNYYVAQYDAAIRFIDEQIGIMLKELRNLNLEKNTVIILTSDHGEAFGEHNLFLVHAHRLYDEFIRVPLIIRFPGNIPTVKVINRQVQLVDIAPTILDILDIGNNYNMKGLSLLPLILTGQGYNRKYAFSTAGIMSCIRTPEWKLILHENTEIDKEYLLFNLKDDTKELVNLKNLREKEFKILKRKLNIWQEQVSSDFIVGGTLDKEIKEKLRSLGYIQ